MHFASNFNNITNLLSTIEELRAITHRERESDLGFDSYHWGSQVDPSENTGMEESQEGMALEPKKQDARGCTAGQSQRASPVGRWPCRCVHGRNPPWGPRAWSVVARRDGFVGGGGPAVARGGPRRAATALVAEQCAVSRGGPPRGGGVMGERHRHMGAMRERLRRPLGRGERAEIRQGGGPRRPECSGGGETDPLS